MTTINSISPYVYTDNKEILATNNIYVYKKLLLHRFTKLNKEMFLNYYENDPDITQEERDNFNKIKSIVIKVKGKDKFFELNYKPYNVQSVPSLYTYPERNLLYTTTDKRKNEEWDSVFKEEDADEETVENNNRDNELVLHNINLKTKIYDVKKKYPNDLLTMKISTASKEYKILQASAVPCADGENGEEICLYMILNDANYEIINGGIYEDEDNNRKLVIPSYAIKNMGIMCDHSQCSQCSNCSNGNCVVYRIYLEQCRLYVKETDEWIIDDSYNPTDWKDILDNKPVDFYFVKKQIIDNTTSDESHYYIEHYDVTTNKGDLHSPFGSIWFDNKGEKIVREYFAIPNAWYTTINTVYFLPMMFNNNNIDICKSYQMTYDYFISKDVFITLTKDAEIKSYISFDKVYNNDELLLGSVEIPQETYIPSYTSTLNINEDCQKGITDVRHDKLINDNHQRIRFDEICSQTNRENLSAVTDIPLLTSND